MKRREFLTAVGCAVSVACLPLPAMGPIAAAPMTATEVLLSRDEYVRSAMLAINRSMDEMVFEAVRVLNPPDRQWFSLSNQDDDLERDDGN